LILSKHIYTVRCRHFVLSGNDFLISKNMNVGKMDCEERETEGGRQTWASFAAAEESVTFSLRTFAHFLY
jgi:hypothetical protein